MVVRVNVFESETSESEEKDRAGSDFKRVLPLGTDHTAAPWSLLLPFGRPPSPPPPIKMGMQKAQNLVTLSLIERFVKT